MQTTKKKITIECIENGKAINPIFENYSQTDKIQIMVKKILQEKIPRLKDNSLLYNLVLYTLTEKMKTVQSVENVLSYIKDNKLKKVEDVLIKNGEIRIKCSV